MKLPQDPYHARLIEYAEETTPLPNGGVRVRTSGHYDFFDEDGLLHNYNGPASCQVNPIKNACEDYCIHGKHLSKEEWQRRRFSYEKEAAIRGKSRDISKLGESFLEVLQRLLRDGMNLIVNEEEYVVRLLPRADSDAQDAAEQFPLPKDVLGNWKGREDGKQEGRPDQEGGGAPGGAGKPDSAGADCSPGQEARQGQGGGQGAQTPGNPNETGAMNRL